MMNIDNLTDDVLSAYLDEELSPEARIALERQLLSEPGARVRLDRFRESDARLRRAFALPSDAAATDPLVQLLKAGAPENTDNVVPMRTSRLRRYAAPLGFAMAATVAGLAIGFGWRGAIDASTTEAGTGLALSHTLSDALDRNVSGQSRSGVNVLFTFRRHDGVLCRQFEVAEGASAGEGVACRSAEKRWQMSVWQASSGAATGYRPASGDGSRIEAEVDALDASGPLSPEEEVQAIRRGW
jgi:hypothetical protein